MSVEYIEIQSLKYSAISSMYCWAARVDLVEAFSVSPVDADDLEFVWWTVGELEMDIY